MFGKKPNTESAIHFIELAIQNSSISVHYENGNYAAFFVTTSTRREDWIQNLMFEESVNSLVTLVEKRIKARKFEDFADKIDASDYREPNWKPNLLAKRIIIANAQPVCSWDVNADMSLSFRRIGF